MAGQGHRSRCEESVQMIGAAKRVDTDGTRVSPKFQESVSGGGRGGKNMTQSHPKKVGCEEKGTRRHMTRVDGRTKFTGERGGPSVSATDDGDFTNRASGNTGEGKQGMTEMLQGISSDAERIAVSENG